MDKTTKGKTTIYKTVSQEDRQYNGQKDERKNNNLQNRKSRKTDNTMDKRRKEKQQSTKP